MGDLRTGPVEEFAEELLAFHPQCPRHGLTFAHAFEIKPEQSYQGRVSVALVHVLDHPVALGVRQRAVAGAPRPHERPLDVLQIEQFVVAIRIGQEAGRFIIARSALHADSGGFREPMRDAVLRLTERDGVGVFVADDAHPIEGALVF